MSGNSTSTTTDSPATSTETPPPSPVSPPANTEPTPVPTTSNPPFTSQSFSPTSSPPSTPPSSSSSSRASTSAPSSPPTSIPTTSTPQTQPPSTLVVTFIQSSDSKPGAVTTVVKTSTSTPSNAASQTSFSSSSTSTAGLADLGTGSGSSGGLSGGGKTAVEVIVPIVAVALIVLAILYFWRKQKQRKDAEEVRRKEVEEYGYNPNEDPALPAVGGAKGSPGDGPFEMRGDEAGYRGWGATAASSSGRKASTAVSGGPVGMAYSEGASPTHGPVSDSRSGDTLIGSPSGQPTSNRSEEVLGAMGPSAAGNRGGDMHRGPSNASSSYSAANQSDASGEGALPGGAYGAAQYYSGDANYGGPYADGSFSGGPGGRAEVSGQPVIRDNLARRATRIENPSHFPTQASAGISQNF